MAIEEMLQKAGNQVKEFGRSLKSEFERNKQYSKEVLKPIEHQLMILRHCYAELEEVNRGIDKNVKEAEIYLHLDNATEYATKLEKLTATKDERKSTDTFNNQLVQFKSELLSNLREMDYGDFEKLEETMQDLRHGIEQHEGFYHVQAKKAPNFEQLKKTGLYAGAAAVGAYIIKRIINR